MSEFNLLDRNRKVKQENDVFITRIHTFADNIKEKPETASSTTQVKLEDC